MAPGDEVTLGVEEEFLLVDPESRRVVPRADEMLEETGDERRGQIGHELQRSQVETGTAVCTTLAEVRSEVVRLRRAGDAAAEKVGCRIASAGTHPFSHPDGNHLTPEPAYLRLADDYQVLTRQQLVCGCHVHAGVADAELAIEVLNRVRPWLAPLLALSVNSPFWLGEDTGYASFRTEVWRRWPMSGTPDPFASRQQYDDLVDDLLRVGAIDSPRRIYWDVRPSARFPTVEFRVADACMSVDETVLVAGLVRALVQTCRQEAIAGRRCHEPRAELLRAATWKAARYGVDGELVDLRGCRSVPARALVDELLVSVRPALEGLGDWDEVSALVDTVFGRGTGAARQRRAFQRAGRLEDVVDLILTETMAG